VSEEKFKLFLEAHGMTSSYEEWLKNGGPTRTKEWIKRTLPLEDSTGIKGKGEDLKELGYFE